MDDEQQKREARLQRSYERLNAHRPRCINCGLEDARCLEAHHIAGRKFGDSLVIVCRNCHRILSDDQKDHPPPAGDDPNLHERIGHFLKGLADLFALLVAKLNEYGEELIAFGKSDAATKTIGGDQ